MPRYIDANAAWKRFYELSKEQNLHPLDSAFNTSYVLNFIESRDTADVEEVKHGKWIQKKHYSKASGEFKTCYYKICSVCHKSSRTKYNHLTKYCTNCGAKMDLKG